MRAEWENFREHDVVFMVCIENPKADAQSILANYEKQQRNARTSNSRPKSDSINFADLFGIKYVRGGTIFEFRDEANVVLNDPTRPDERPSGKRAGSKRKLRMHLDPVQYYGDMKDGVDCYERLNLLVRRDAKENNFKAILETIRDLINTAAVGRAIPSWLQDIFLGYGNPTAANYRSLTTSVVEENNYEDTFLNAQHVKEAFPKARNINFQVSPSNCNSIPGKELNVVIKNDGVDSTDTFNDSDLPPPPYHLTITRNKKDSDVIETVVARGYSKANPGPYPEDQPLRNPIRFTPTQIEAVRSGINEGLTMVVGPPGTGKTDVAVQIITTLYHNNPTQKILLVTHSNAALNDLFEKIMQRDIAPRHLLRLGSGERELRETLDARTSVTVGANAVEINNMFSKQGRVNWSLMRRLQLLAQVQRLGKSLSGTETVGSIGDVGSSCETAAYFQLEFIQSRIEKFRIEVERVASERASGIEVTTDTTVNKASSNTNHNNSKPCDGISTHKIDAHAVANVSGKEDQALCTNSYASSSTVISTTIADLFPFKEYFSDAPKPIFSVDGENWEADLDAAEGCFRHINRIFEELADYRAFELLRTQSLRSDFLLTKQARIVAMTCTHAAMTRRRLVELGFKYDSIIMEEAAQVLEVETLVPMLLQDTDPVDGCRLKRVVLIGDHHQLPPVVKHQAFQKFSKLEQSLFTRFVRLGVPTVQLDKQGRARKEIAALYSWRYKQLGNLQDVVVQQPQFQYANAGFEHTFQFIDVPDFQNKGEICPTAYFFQNLGEAEYVVAVYQYMRLLGYPAEKISIITTYNGQMHLIRDVLGQRCQNPMFGMPASVSTVDKFQGQQNDYVLLSMVRTEHVGHIRDVRRLVVALSRARLGLYVFGRQKLFQGCYELANAFNLLLAKPSKLQLVAGEMYGSTTRLSDVNDNSNCNNNSLGDSQRHSVEDTTAMGVLVYQMVQQSQHMHSESHVQQQKDVVKPMEVSGN